MQRQDSTLVIASVHDKNKLNDLCEHQSYSNHTKKLELTDIPWDPASSAVIARMLAHNYGLKEVALRGNPGQKETKNIVAGLNHNFDILRFEMTCDEATERRIKRILERNFQFRIVQRFLIIDLLKTINLNIPTLQEQIDRVVTLNRSDATADEVSEALFHLRMRSQHEYSEMSYKIQQVIILLKKLKHAGLHHEVTALQAAAVKNMPDYVRGLLANGADVNSQNALGHTALLAAVDRGNIEVVKILCAHGADKTLQDHTGNTPLSSALASEWHDIAAHLSQGSTTNQQTQLTARRKLIIGFGPRLFKQLPELGNSDLNNFGGSAREGFSLLAGYLEKFSQHHKLDFKLRSIAEHFRTAVDSIKMTQTEKLKILKRNGILHTISGCIQHMIGVTLIKKDARTYQLTIADRGLYYHRSEKIYGHPKKSIMRSLPIPEGQLPIVLDLLEKSIDEDVDTAERILFNEIPLLVQNIWQHHTRSNQSPLKDGICFFGNLKPLLRHHFEYSYGDNKGYLKYKEFTQFLRQQLIKDYAQHTNSDDPYLFIANKRIEEKYGDSRMNKPGK